MLEVKFWPPPAWTSVAVRWDWLMEHHGRDPNEIYNWVIREPGGQFHLSGLDNVGGFDYRFERPEDATWFRLNLPR
jgi:hypothetical protein